MDFNPETKAFHGESYHSDYGTMRQILTFVCLLLAIGTQAQTGTAKKAVDEIREQYASAKQRIEYNNKSEETRNQMTVNLSHMVPGTGHQEKVVTFYFTTYFDENVNEYISKPYFITATYNVAARKCYDEYLVDDKGNVVFAYLSGDSFDTAIGREEGRFYWKGGRLVHKQVKGTDVAHESVALQQGKNLVQAFTLMMTQ